MVPGFPFLARTGLLDNKPATTHWHYFEQFSNQFPKVDLKRDFFTTQCDKLHCAASINSLADVTVHLIENILVLKLPSTLRKTFHMK